MAAKVLRRLGITSEVVGVWDAKDILAALKSSKTPITHCVIEAAFVGTGDLANIIYQFPRTEFVCRNHSQIGFLQVEAGAIRLFREYAHLQEEALNFRLSANNERFCVYEESVYGQRCLWLPNLYYLDDRTGTRLPASHNDRLVRISSFGSMRLLKNHTTAAAAALMIARKRRQDLEFFINSNREEHGKGVANAIREMFSGLLWAKVIEVPWQPWTHFRHSSAHMDLCLQPSFTESFNFCTADAAAEGVPSVVGECVDWCPDHWKAEIDSAEDVARVGMALLANPHSGQEGIAAVQRWEAKAEHTWLTWLKQGQQR